jgi:methionyl-tRNA synthetase
MGHVLEKVLADVCARWFRLRGDEVRFQIGTDEHGVKIQRTAEKEGLKPQALVDRNVILFEDLYKRLGISSDIFIRTSDKKRHYPTVQALWKKLQEKGLLEKRKYTGLYCSGCEKFLTKKELTDGKCPNHLTTPEHIEEENWFFLLKQETAWLQKLLTTPPPQGYQIVPEFRAQETLSLLGQGLEDVSFSRPKSSLSWGVPVPGDDNQVMYVWCDALTNYISGLGYFTGHEERLFWDEATVTHVIGKDIARFHALIWPAMLKGAGVRTPDRLLIHGFLNISGQKMSKSLGNVISPDEILKKLGGEPDPLRFFLSHEIPVGRDGDFSWERFEELYDAKLRNNIGNLLNRVLVLLLKDGGMLRNVEGDRDLWSRYSKAMDTFDLSGALQYALLLADEGNRMIDDRKPWALKGEEKKLVLSKLAELLRHLSLMLLPFIPETAKRMSLQLSAPYAKNMLEKNFVITDEVKKWGGCVDWKQVGEPEILFPPLS